VPKSTTALGLLYKRNGLYGSLIAKTNGSQYAKDGEPAAYQIGAYTVTDLTLGYRWRVGGPFVKAVSCRPASTTCSTSRM
jgi:iron complex outermembrane receptor protein